MCGEDELLMKDVPISSGVKCAYDGTCHDVCDDVGRCVVMG